MSGNVTTTKISCPISTPALNVKSDSASDALGSSRSRITFENPRPWTSPNRKVIRQRRPSRSSSKFSTATQTMLSAMRLSMSTAGSDTTPNVANASVMVCATVKAVTIFTTSSSDAGTDEQHDQKRQMIVTRDDVFHAERDESPCRIECRRRAAWKTACVTPPSSTTSWLVPWMTACARCRWSGRRELVKGRIDGQAGHRLGEHEPQVEPQQVPAGQPVAVQHHALGCGSIGGKAVVGLDSGEHLLDRGVDLLDRREPVSVEVDRRALVQVGGADDERDPHGAPVNRDARGAARELVGAGRDGPGPHR